MFPLKKCLKVSNLISVWIGVRTDVELTIASTVVVSCPWIIRMMGSASPWPVRFISVCKFSTLLKSIVSEISLCSRVSLLTFSILLLKIWIFPQHVLGLIVSKVIGTGLERSIVVQVTCYLSSDIGRRSILTFKVLRVSLGNTLSISVTHTHWGLRAWNKGANRVHGGHLHLLLKESSILKLVHHSLEELLVLILLLVDFVPKLGVVVMILVHAMLISSVLELRLSLSESTA